MEKHIQGAAGYNPHMLVVAGRGCETSNQYSTTSSLTCAVQMLLVALSLLMCCSLVCIAIRRAGAPVASIDTPMILQTMQWQTHHSHQSLNMPAGLPAAAMQVMLLMPPSSAFQMAEESRYQAGLARNAATAKAAAAAVASASFLSRCTKILAQA